MKYFKFNLLTAVFFCTALATNLKAAGAGAEKSKNLETVEIMDKLLIKLTTLKLYFISREKFTDPKNAKEISTNLKEFAELAKLARHDENLSQTNFKFSNQVLEEHITDTERIFRQGNKEFARWKLASTVSVCMSCHTQIPTANKSFVDFGNYKMFSSDFDQAEFLFATRGFEQALVIYDRIIDGYPKNSDTLANVETSLERQLAYFSRIRRSPVEAIAKIKLHQNNKELPEFLQKNLKIWIKQFENWESQVTPDPKASSDNQILAFAKKNIVTKWTSSTMEATNPDLIPYLRVSGILYEYLSTHPKSKATPEILYWLAICDRSISENFFYSLADLYLKECILKYSTAPISKDCYKEYELETISSYSGSAGTNLPSEVRNELVQMKKLIETKPKVKLR